MIILPAIFTDHAVLQQGKRVAVWGETDGAGIEAVLVKGGEEVICSVRAALTPVEREMAGKVPPPLPEESFDTENRKVFSAFLEPQLPGGPYTLIIREADRRSEINLSDIWFGEVFLAGGQSNMELNLKDSRNGKEEVARSENPNIRFYCTPKVAYVGEELFEQERSSGWTYCNPDTSYYQSAIGYYFAKDLSQRLNRMVGVINCNWGGTSATCWIGRDAVLANPELVPYLEAYEKASSGMSEEEYLKALEEYRIYDIEFNKKLAQYYATAESPSWNGAIAVCGECRYPGPMGPRTWCRPNGLYESMLSRVAPYTAAAFLFYQAEEDDNRPFTYAKLLPVLMKEWRRIWNDEKMPFLLVQLPGYNGEEETDLMNWPIIREIQQKTADTDAYSAMAVTIDLGNRTNVHPLDKKPVGERLSLQAQYLLYGLITEEQAAGPLYETARFEGNRVFIKLKNAGDGLRVKLPAEWNAFDPEEAEKGGFEEAGQKNLNKITGFELAGKDRIYYNASVINISGDTLCVESGEVPEPQFVRYLWRNFAQVTLYGKKSIPLAPFRSSEEDGAMPIGSRQGKLLE